MAEHKQEAIVLGAIALLIALLPTLCFPIARLAGVTFWIYGPVVSYLMLFSVGLAWALLAGYSLPIRWIWALLLYSFFVWIFMPVVNFASGPGFILGAPYRAVFHFLIHNNLTGLGNEIVVPGQVGLTAVTVIYFLLACVSASIIWRKRRTLFRAGFGNEYRSRSSVFGDAHWGQWKKMKKVISPENTGIVLGEDYDPRRNPKNYAHEDPKTWGSGGKRALIKMRTGFENGHSLIVCGSGGGKTSSFVMPTCFEYPQSIVVVDPKREILETCAAARRAMGRKTVEVNLDNAIDIITIMTPYFDSEMFSFRDLAEILTPRAKKSEFSDFYAREVIDFIAAMLEYYHKETQEDPLSSLGIIVGQSGEHLQTACKKISRETKLASVKKILAQFDGKDSKFFTYFHSVLKEATSWCMYPEVVQAFSAQSQENLKAITGDVDVFITIKRNQLKNLPSVLRTILGVIAYDMENRSSQKHERLMIVDEAAVVGYLSLFETIRDTSRSNKLHLMMIFQSLGQISEIYGPEGLKTWKTVAACSYSAISDEREAKSISEIVGTYTADIEGKSSSSNSRGIGITSDTIGSTVSTNVQRAQLINPDQLMRLPADSQILILSRQPPLLCAKAFWFRREEWKERAGQAARAGHNDTDLEEREGSVIDEEDTFEPAPPEEPVMSAEDEEVARQYDEILADYNSLPPALHEYRWKLRNPDRSPEQYPGKPPPKHLFIKRARIFREYIAERDAAKREAENAAKAQKENIKQEPKEQNTTPSNSLKEPAAQNPPVDGDVPEGNEPASEITNVQNIEDAQGTLPFEASPVSGDDDQQQAPSEQTTEDPPVQGDTPEGEEPTSENTNGQDDEGSQGIVPVEAGTPSGDGDQQAPSEQAMEMKNALQSLSDGKIKEDILLHILGTEAPEYQPDIEVIQDALALMNQGKLTKNAMDQIIYGTKTE